MIHHTHGAFEDKFVDLAKKRLGLVNDIGKEFIDGVAIPKERWDTSLLLRWGKSIGREGRDDKAESG